MNATAGVVARLGRPRARHAGVLLTALVVVAPAAGHVTAAPDRISASTTTRVTVTAEEERPGHRTTTVVLEAGSDIALAAGPTPVGTLSRVGDTLVWSRDGVPRAGERPTVVVDVTAGPRSGRASLRMRQVYEDGVSRSWDVELLVGPAAGRDAPREHVTLALVVAGVGFAVAGVVVVRRHRRRIALQHR